MKRTHVTTTPAPKPPEGSLDLLRFAIDGGDSTREISRRLGLNSNALNLARHRGRLSPSSAAALANYLGLDAVYWTAFAALEAEPDTPLKASLLAKIKASAKAFHNA